MSAPARTVVMNSGSGGGMDFTMIAIGLIILLGLGLLVAWAINPDLFKGKKEGDACTVKNGDSRGTYEIDSEGDCVLVYCDSGWEVDGNRCVAQAVTTTPSAGPSAPWAGPSAPSAGPSAPSPSPSTPPSPSGPLSVRCNEHNREGVEDPFAVFGVYNGKVVKYTDPDKAGKHDPNWVSAPWASCEQYGYDAKSSTLPLFVRCNENNVAGSADPYAVFGIVGGVPRRVTDAGIAATWDGKWSDAPWASCGDVSAATNLDFKSVRCNEHNNAGVADPYAVFGVYNGKVVKYTDADKAGEHDPNWVSAPWISCANHGYYETPDNLT